MSLREDLVPVSVCYVEKINIVAWQPPIRYNGCLYGCLMCRELLPDGWAEILPPTVVPKCIPGQLYRELLPLFCGEYYQAPAQSVKRC